MEEAKGTYCGRCGHTHVKGTPCPRPFKEGLKNPKDNPCWRGYHPVGTKMKDGKEVPNCVPVNEMHTMDHDNAAEHQHLPADHEEGLEVENYCPHCLAEYIYECWNSGTIEEAEYRGRKVSLGKPFLTPGGPKKRSVYVKNAKGNVVKVNFGDPNMRIKKSNPKRRKSYRARHHCQTPGPRWKANYWSCRAW